MGEPIRLDPFQKYILSRKWEYDPHTGHLLHDRVLIGMAKGNAKTELMAGDADAELAGPIAPLSPNVVVSASSWDQANRLFGACRLMIEQGPLAETFAGHLFEDRITRPDRPGILSRIAAIAGTNDGGLPTAHYGDEIHEWEGERRERVFVVLGNGLKKRTPHAELPDGRVRRGAQQVGITTAGDSPTSLLRRLYDHGVKVASGEVRDPRFLFMWWEADHRLDLEREEDLVAAIRQSNPAVGSFLSMDNLLERFADPTLARYEFERYHLNRWVSPPDSWISLDAWMALRHPQGLIAPKPKATITLGFDGSVSRDTTALVGCKGEHVFVLKAWERPRGDVDWTVPRTEVDNAVDKAFADYDVQRMYMDPPRWERELDDWSRRYGEQRVLAFDTNVAERMAPAVGHFSDAVAEGRLTHDGDPVLARHIANARAKETRWGLVITKEHKDSPRRIDAAVAAVLAHEAAHASAARPVNRSLHTWS